MNFFKRFKIGNWGIVLNGIPIRVLIAYLEELAENEEMILIKKRDKGWNVYKLSTEGKEDHGKK